MLAAKAWVFLPWKIWCNRLRDEPEEGMMKIWFEGTSRWKASSKIFLRCYLLHLAEQQKPLKKGRQPQKEYFIFQIFKLLGGGFKHFLFSPLLGEDSHVD